MILKFFIKGKLLQNQNSSPNITNKVQTLEMIEDSQTKLNTIFCETLRTVRALKSKSEHDDSSKNTKRNSSNEIINELESDYDKMLQKLENNKQKKIFIIKERKELTENKLRFWDQKQKKIDTFRENKVLFYPLALQNLLFIRNFFFI